MGTYNQRIVALSIERIDLCDLLIATAALSEPGNKWERLHDLLEHRLQAFDDEHWIERELDWLDSI